MHLRWGFVLLLLLGLQAFSRYAGAPRVDLCADDWSYLVQARAHPDYAAAAGMALKETDRPFGAALMAVTLRLVDERVLHYALYSLLTHSLFLLFLALMVRRLTGDLRAVLIAGLLFCLWPQLTDTFQWPTMIAYTPGFTAFMAAGYCWVSFIATSRLGWALAAAGLQLFGSGTYEVGVLLPAAYAVLVTRAGFKKQVTGLALVGAATALYLAWRKTHGFGLAGGVLFEPREIALNVRHMLWVGKEFVSGWCGENLLACFTNGFQGSLTMPKWWWRALFFADVVVVAALAALLARVWARPAEAPATAPFTRGRALVFALAWLAVTAAPCLVSWVAGRLHVLPAVGISLALALVLAPLRSRAWIPALAVFALAALLTNQGTSWMWHENGVFHRRLFAHLQAHERDWADAQAVLIDTRAVRERLTPGILGPAATHPSTWAYYGNTSFMRGFVPMAMLAMLRPQGERPDVVYDIECGARWEGDNLIWHVRWNPGLPRSTPRAGVYVVDLLDAGAGAP